VLQVGPFDIRLAELNDIAQWIMQPNDNTNRNWDLVKGTESVGDTNQKPDSVAIGERNTKSYAKPIFPSRKSLGEPHICSG
jgi:hypothetical protein